jgi:hypothetical protein
MAAIIELGEGILAFVGGGVIVVAGVVIGVVILASIRS